MIFLEKLLVQALHDRQLGEHGGLAGVLDEALLDSALSEPPNKHDQGVDDIHALAAAYAFGIARHHPLLDANKRTALHAALVFLRVDGTMTPIPSMELVEPMVRVAEGALDEIAFARRLKAQPVRG